MGSEMCIRDRVTKILSMGTLIVYGFLKGFQPIAGYSYGAKKYERLLEAIRTAALWSTIFGIIFGLAAAIFSGPIMTQFTSGDAQMIQTGQRALQINGLSFMLFGVYTVYSFLFLVMGKAREGCILGACRQGICFLPAILLLPRIFGLNGVILAQPVADVLSFVITIIMAVRLHRELRMARSKESLTEHGSNRQL